MSECSKEVNKALCTCFKCKKNDIQNIGKIVHNSTKWRHKQKTKNWKYSTSSSSSEINRLY